MNPFTAPLRILPRMCECHPMALHDEDCPATPIYARLNEEINSVFGLLHDLTYAAIVRQAQFQKWWEET